MSGFDHKDKMTLRATKAVSDVLWGLKRYRSAYLFAENQRVKSSVIERKLNLTGSEVRAIIAHLRLQGHPVGSDGRGYFWAVSPRDLQATIDHFAGREEKLAEVRHALMRTQAELGQGDFYLDGDVYARGEVGGQL